MPKRKHTLPPDERPYEMPDGSDVPQEVLEHLRRLTYMQGMYCLYYFAGPEGVRGNQTQAALAAGFSRKTAASQASNMMKRDDIRAVLDALLRASAKQALISHSRFVELALEQANAWKDRESGLPLEVPLVSNGQIVIAEFVVRDHRGNIVMTENEKNERVPRTMKQPVVELARPNAANVQALALVGKACGYIAEARGGEGAGAGAGAGDMPTTGYPATQMPDGKLDGFLDTLPAPVDTGARTATEAPPPMPVGPPAQA